MNGTKVTSKLVQTIKAPVLIFVKELGILALAGIAGILLLTLVYCIPVNQELKESTFEYAGQNGNAVTFRTFGGKLGTAGLASV